ncbi:MAG TPA: ATP-binding protein, partial [Acidobacteriota bacterium]
SRLGDLLRVSLENAGRESVSLKEELEFLQGYLEIEQTRFRDRLAVELDIDPLALDARVPNLILQPLVENAIRHGIAPRAAPGRVRIRARLRGGLLQLQVLDSGPGVGADIERLFSSGVGLSNTRARLQQLYGPRHRFELRNASGGGLQVTLAFPIETPISPALESATEA